MLSGERKGKIFTKLASSTTSSLCALLPVCEVTGTLVGRSRMVTRALAFSPTREYFPRRLDDRTEWRFRAC